MEMSVKAADRGRLFSGAAGPVLNFVLLSWLYAFYFFDYKWTLTNVPLVTRVQHFEGHFAFFAGEIS